MNTCQNPACGQVIEVEPGHRPRRYCNDACKQTAYRLRQDAAEQERIEQERIEAERRELETLRAQYGDLLPDTLQLLYSLRKQGHYRLVDTVGRALLAEKEHARLTELQERNDLTEEVMQLGETMDYRSMVLGSLGFCFTIMPGVDGWAKFVGHADIDMLRLARDTAHYETEGYQRSRKRLKELSDLS